jgi:hypothetical protein
MIVATWVHSLQSSLLMFLLCAILSRCDGVLEGEGGNEVAVASVDFTVWVLPRGYIFWSRMFFLCAILSRCDGVFASASGGWVGSCPHTRARQCNDRGPREPQHGADGSGRGHGGGKRWRQGAEAEEVSVLIYYGCARVRPTTTGWQAGARG